MQTEALGISAAPSSIRIQQLPRTDLDSSNNLHLVSQHRAVSLQYCKWMGQKIIIRQLHAHQSSTAARRLWVAPTCP